MKAVLCISSTDLLLHDVKIGRSVILQVCTSKLSLNNKMVVILLPILHKCI